jgi:hypothetical protein
MITSWYHRLTQRVVRFAKTHRKLMRVLKWTNALVNIAAGGIFAVTVIVPKTIQLLGWSEFPAFSFQTTNLYLAGLLVMAIATAGVLLKLLRNSLAHRRLLGDHRNLKQTHCDVSARYDLLSSERQEDQTAMAALERENSSLRAEKSNLAKRLGIISSSIREFAESEGLAADLTKQRMANLNPLLLNSRHRAEAIDRTLAIIDIHLRHELQTACKIVRAMCQEPIVMYVTTIRRFGEGTDRFDGAKVEIVYCEPQTHLNRRGEFDIAAETATQKVLREGHVVWSSNDLVYEMQSGRYRNTILTGWEKIIQSKCAVAIPSIADNFDSPTSMLSVDSRMARFDEATERILKLYASRIAPLLYSTQALREMRKKISRSRKSP